MIEKNFIIMRGTEFRATFIVTINGDPDLTEYEPQAQIRKFADSDDLIGEFTFEPAQLDETGQFDIVLTQSLNIAPGKYFYDVRLVKNGKPLYIARGGVQFITPVTRA